MGPGPDPAWQGDTRALADMITQPVEVLCLKVNEVLQRYTGCLDFCQLLFLHCLSWPPHMPEIIGGIEEECACKEDCYQL